MTTNLVRLGVIRDFFQITALLYEGLGTVLPESYRFIYENVTAVFTFHFAYFADEDRLVSVLIFSALVVIALLFLIQLFRLKNERLQHTMSLYRQFEVSSFALSTLFLPLCQYSIETLLAVTDNLYISRYSQGTKIYLIIVSSFALAIASISSFVIFYAVRSTLAFPPSQTDSNRSIEQQLPFSSLVIPFRYGQQYYQIIILALKAVLIFISGVIIPSKLFTDFKTVLKAQSSVIFVILTLWSILSFFARLHHDVINSLLDRALRVLLALSLQCFVSPPSIPLTPPPLRFCSTSVNRLQRSSLWPA